MIEFGKEVAKKTAKTLKPTRSRLLLAGALFLTLHAGAQIGTAIKDSRQPDICHQAEFPEPVMPFTPGMEPITIYCRSLPNDPPIHSLIGQCLKGVRITHTIEVKMPDHMGFIPISDGTLC